MLELLRHLLQLGGELSSLLGRRTGGLDREDDIRLPILLSSVSVGSCHLGGSLQAVEARGSEQPSAGAPSGASKALAASTI